MINTQNKFSGLVLVTKTTWQTKTFSLYLQEVPGFKVVWNYIYILHAGWVNRFQTGAFILPPPRSTLALTLTNFKTVYAMTTDFS